jgi:hypothetical protein
MQTLGLSESTPRTEGRLKSIFWPTIRNQWDLDYVTTQGFWICFAVGAMTFVFGLFAGAGLFGLLDFLFFLLAGCGVRRRSRAAALIALSMYTLSGISIQLRSHQGFGVLRILFIAVLLANVRGIWISAAWPEPEPDPHPLTAPSLFDRMSDRLPGILWPRTAWLFYILAALEVLGLLSIFLTNFATEV